MAKNTHTTTTTEKASPHSYHAAFDNTAAARAALEPAEILTINLDVQIALTTVLGTLSRLASLRDDIVASLPDFDIGQFDKLSTYAEALAHAQSAYLAASEPAEMLPALAARAVEIRDQLVSDATALAKRGLLDGKRLSDLKGGPGYLNINSDVGVLVRMLRERWTEITSKSAIQPAELDEAGKLFERITFAYAERTQQSATVAAAVEDRQRAYTLLVHAYDQARRAATYLRWVEGDVDKIVPSLWAGRGGGRSAGSNVTPAGNNGGAPPAGEDVPGGLKPATPDPGGVAPVHAGTPGPGPVAPGHPGGSPFSNN
jgi:hypothetical protein